MHRSIVTAALFGAAALAACSKEAPKADSTAVAQAGAAAAPTAGYDPATRVATVLATDFAFTGPDTVPAGWTTFKLINNGQTLHHMSIFRLDGGKTLADLQAAMNSKGPTPAWAVEVGGPNAPDPTSTSNGTFDMKAGNYVAICFIDMPGAVPHFMKGMVKPFVVTASTAAGTAPTADVTVALSDYAFTVKTGTLSAGKHTIQVVNEGPQVHEVEVIKLAPGKTMKDLGAWMAKPEGPPPASAIGGVAGLVKGASGFFDVELSAGSYAIVCFVTDAKDKKPHLEHGMIKEITIQ